MTYKITTQKKKNKNKKTKKQWALLRSFIYVSN